MSKRFRFVSFFSARLFAFGVLVGLVGCTVAAVKQEPLQGSWTFRLGAGEADIGQTLVFADGDRFGGYAGCNRYTGTVETDHAGAVRFGAIAATKRACLDEGKSRAESDFLTMLERVRGYNYAQQRLQLVDARGVLLAEFERVEIADR